MCPGQRTVSKLQIPFQPFNLSIPFLASKTSLIILMVSWSDSSGAKISPSDKNITKISPFAKWKFLHSLRHSDRRISTSKLSCCQLFLGSKRIFNTSQIFYGNIVTLKLFVDAGDFATIFKGEHYEHLDIWFIYKIGNVIYGHFLRTAICPVQVPLKVLFLQSINLLREENLQFLNLIMFQILI